MTKKEAYKLQAGMMVSMKWDGHEVETKAVILEKPKKNNGDDIKILPYGKFGVEEIQHCHYQQIKSVIEENVFE